VCDDAGRGFLAIAKGFEKAEELVRAWRLENDQRVKVALIKSKIRKNEQLGRQVPPKP
jgi:hypothetical protein